MDNSLVYIAIGVVFFVLGWVISHWLTVNTFTEILWYFDITPEDIQHMYSELEVVKKNEDSEIDNENDIAITVEQIDGILYAYTKENPKFLAQGKSREELIEKLSVKLYNKNVLISEDDEGFEIMYQPQEK